eukprot:704972-Amorphochlora_amoeboformis.AAC.2
MTRCQDSDKQTPYFNFQHRAPPGPPPEVVTRCVVTLACVSLFVTIIAQCHPGKSHITIGHAR